MAESVVTRFTGYDTREGTNAQGDWKVHIFQTEAGFDLRTFKPNVAQTAKELFDAGAQVEAAYYTKQQGDYTNYTLVGVRRVDGSVATTNGGASAGAPSTPPAPTVSRKDIQIARGAGLKQAVQAVIASGENVSENLTITFALAEEFAAYILDPESSPLLPGGEE